MRTWLKNGKLIDGTGAPARDGGIVIEGETIVHVGPLAAGDAPSGADPQVVDLAGRTVVPGLVEAHIHLSYNNVNVIADLDLNCPPEYSTLVSARNAELALSHGYTAARSAGSVHLTALEAITCATRHGGELMRMQDRIGTLEAGKLADLVVVNGDPLKDITVLQDRSRLSVMKGGRFVTRNLS